MTRAFRRSCLDARRALNGKIDHAAQAVGPRENRPISHGTGKSPQRPGLAACVHNGPAIDHEHVFASRKRLVHDHLDLAGTPWTGDNDESVRASIKPALQLFDDITSMVPNGTQPLHTLLVLAAEAEAPCLRLEPLVDAGFGEAEGMLNVKLDKELANGVKYHDRDARKESRDDGDHDTWVTGEPIPDAVRLDAFHVREAQDRAVLASPHAVRHDEAVEAVACHDGVSYPGKANGRIPRRLFGVPGLRDDVGNFAVSSEEAVQDLFR